MRVLDLFSGIGGFSLGLERAGMETVAFCEIEDYPRKVLAKHWPNIPIYDDVRTLTKERLDSNGIGSIDVICGGFPCQDISTAGRQAGIGEETRSGLWSECARLLGEIRPQFAIFENVTNLLNGGGGDWFKRVLWDISQIGYDVEWHCIPASELGAHHHRDRIWIMVYPNKTPSKGGWLSSRIHQELSNAYGRSDHWCAGHNVADPIAWRQSRQGELEQSIYPEAVADWQAAKPVDGCVGQIWQAEPELGRVVDGVWDKSYGHRLAALGNAVVPQIPEIIGRAIMGIES
jgi:DNA (cytosine-5)-methyltransferase 1